MAAQIGQHEEHLIVKASRECVDLFVIGEEKILAEAVTMAADCHAVHATSGQTLRRIINRAFFEELVFVENL